VQFAERVAHIDRLACRAEILVDGDDTEVAQYRLADGPVRGIGTLRREGLGEDDVHTIARQQEARRALHRIDVDRHRAMVRAEGCNQEFAVARLGQFIGGQVFPCSERPSRGGADEVGLGGAASHDVGADDPGCGQLVPCHVTESEQRAGGQSARRDQDRLGGDFGYDRCRGADDWRYHRTDSVGPASRARRPTLAALVPRCSLKGHPHSW
jgi:hypothetical protein